MKCPARPPRPRARIDAPSGCRENRTIHPATPTNRNSRFIGSHTIPRGPVSAGSAIGRAAALVLFGSAACDGISIRHDVDDSLYRSMGNRFPCVVAVMEGGGDVGSGVLVRSNLVLTAAHVATILDDGPGDDAVRFSSEEEFEVDSVWIHPWYVPAGVGPPTYDFAILSLRFGVADVEPAPLDSFHVANGSEVIWAGFGSFGNGQDGLEAGDGKLRAASNLVTLLDSQSIITTFDAPGSGSETDLEGTSVQGDSGGPMFFEYDGTARVVGISSYGSATNGLYGTTAVAGRISSASSWISAAIGSLPGPDCDRIAFPIVRSFGAVANEFRIEFATVGDPGNPDDSGTTGAYHSPRGAVAEPFLIAIHAVSREMITKANAEGDLGISMYDMTGYGGNVGTHPATGVSWNEAARFVNWLNTSSGYGPAYKFAAGPGEAGYDSNSNIELWNPGEAGYDPDNRYRSTRAAFFLPSENQWYKAAYYSGTGSTYYDYATQQDDPDAPVPVPGGTACGTAVYNQSSTTGPADIDDAGGPGHYGTVGQGGNIWEWMETAGDGINDLPSDNRTLRGGAFNYTLAGLDSSYGGTAFPPGYESYISFGFRVALVAESPARKFFDDTAAAAGLTGGDAEPCSTPFHDGVSNLMKYACNMNLAGPDRHTMAPGGTSGLPSGTFDETPGNVLLRFEYLRRKASGLIYSPQKSETLAEGSFGEMGGTRIVTDVDAEWERVVIEESFDPATTPRCFARLVITLP